MGTTRARSMAMQQLLPCIIFFIILLIVLSPPFANAAPIRVPNLQQCELATDVSVGPPPLTTLQFNCCLPIPAKKVINFSFSKYKSSKHVRRAAHTVSEEYIAKYTRAYELMKALPEDDPRSFMGQAKLHCAFCSGAYRQAGNESVQLQVHFSWLFLPWHRWYLYFHERILGSLLGDPSFSLVFWNWDDQRDGGNVMPAMFVRKGTALYDAKRNQANLPPALVNLSPPFTSNNNTLIIHSNLNSMYHSVVNANTAELFMGAAYRTGTDVTNSGNLVNGAHSGIHVWTGDPTEQLNQDMGNAATSSKDPIFYAHHSNVDRLWDKWRYGLPGGHRANHNDFDFLNAEFYFYDETGSLVKVNVKDSLDNTKLGISYPAVAADSLWVNFSPPASTNCNAVSAARAAGAPSIFASPQNGSISLGSHLTAIVKTYSSRPRPSSKSVQVLIIQGLQAARTTFVSMLVFVNLPSANSSTAITNAEYVGTFYIFPSASHYHLRLITNVKFEIGNNLQRIGIQNDPEIVITLVVSDGAPPISIQGLLIDYE